MTSVDYVLFIIFMLVLDIILTNILLGIGLPMVGAYVVSYVLLMLATTKLAVFYRTVRNSFSGAFKNAFV